MRHLAEGRTPEQALEEGLTEIELLCEQRNYRQAEEIGQRLLRAHPTSARVHEAIGDVAAAYGSHQEAVQWYELTLRLGFDQRVMDKLSEQRRRQSQAQAAEAPEPLEDTETEPHYRLIAAVAGSVVLLVVLALLIMSARNGGRLDAPSSPRAPRAVATRATPPTSAPPRRSVKSGSATPSQPAQRTDGKSVPRSTPPNVQTPQQDLPPVHITRAIDAPLTDEDRALMAALNSLSWPNGQSLSGDVNVMVDPYTGYAFITLKLPSALKGSTQFSTGLNMAYSCAVAAIKADRSVRSLTIRMAAAIDTGNRQRVVTVFRGNTNRPTLERYIDAGTTPNTKEIWEGVFATTWWNPSIATDKAL